MTYLSTGIAKGAAAAFNDRVKLGFVETDIFSLGGSVKKIKLKRNNGVLDSFYLHEPK